MKKASKQRLHAPMHQILEVVRQDTAFWPSGVARKALRTLAMFINSAESLPSGTGLATMTALQRSTMLLKSMSAPLPAHCRFASAQIHTYLPMGAP